MAVVVAVRGNLYFQDLFNRSVLKQRVSDQFIDMRSD